MLDGAASQKIWFQASVSFRCRIGRWTSTEGTFTTGVVLGDVAIQNESAEPRATRIAERFLQCGSSLVPLRRLLVSVRNAEAGRFGKWLSDDLNPRW
jgi:hypothetical protein